MASPAPRPGGQAVLSFAGNELRYLRRLNTRVVDWGHAPLPAGALSGGVIVDAPAVGLAIAEAFTTFNLPRDHTIVSMAARGARATLLDLPWVKERELREVVADEAPRSLGVGADTHHIAWQRIRTVRDSRKVYVIAVPRSALFATIDACRIGGVTPDAFDLTLVSIVRSVNQRDAVIVNVEADTVEVAIVVDDLTLALESRALETFDPNAEIAAAVGQTIALHEDSFPERALEEQTPIYLAGRIEEDRAIELAALLTSRTGHRVARPLPPIHLPVDLPVSEHLVNVGLALKEI